MLESLLKADNIGPVEVYHDGGSEEPVHFEDQNMAIRNDDWAAIRAAIDAAMEEHLHPQGWRRAFRVLRELAPLGGVFMVVIGLIAIIVALTIGVTNRREADANFRGPLNRSS